MHLRPGTEMAAVFILASVKRLSTKTPRNNPFHQSGNVLQWMSQKVWLDFAFLCVGVSRQALSFFGFCCKKFSGV